MKNIDIALVGELGLPTDFPTTFFPVDLEQYRQDLIAETTIPGDFAAAGMLAATSGAIGNSVVGWLGTRRFVQANLYMLMIGDPGTGKSPATENTLAPIHREQTARLQAALQPPVESFQRRVADVAGGGITGDAYSGDFVEGFANFDRDDDEGALIEPNPSKVRYLHLTDATIAGVREALVNNPRGIVVEADEAVSLFKGSGKANDRPIWLEMWNGKGLTISRRSGKPPIITIPLCFVTLIAGTQPDIFPQLLNPRGDDGLLDRTLIFGEKTNGWPRYSHCRTDPSLAAVYNGSIDRLLQHRDEQPATFGSRPEVLDISDACSRVFEACHNEITDVFDRVRAPRQFGGLITKLVANATRLAVVRACSRWAAEGAETATSPSGISEQDAIEACNVARFSLGRALLWRPELVGSVPARVAAPTTGSVTNSCAASVVAPPANDLHLQIVDYAGRLGKSEVEVSKLRSSRCFGTASSAELRAACDVLVALDCGQWQGDRKNTLVFPPHLFGTDTEAND